MHANITSIFMTVSGASGAMSFNTASLDEYVSNASQIRRGAHWTLVL
jgi:hypothetical protein